MHDLLPDASGRSALHLETGVGTRNVDRQLRLAREEIAVVKVHPHDDRVYLRQEKRPGRKVFRRQAVPQAVLAGGPRFEPGVPVVRKPPERGREHFRRRHEHEGIPILHNVVVSEPADVCQGDVGIAHLLRVLRPKVFLGMVGAGPSLSALGASGRMSREERRHHLHHSLSPALRWA